MGGWLVTIEVVFNGVVTLISPRAALRVDICGCPFFYMLPNNNRKTLLIQKKDRIRMITSLLANLIQLANKE